MKIKKQTQLTLSGKEAEDYLNFRIELKESGCMSFKEYKIKNSMSDEDKENKEIIKSVMIGMKKRVESDGAWIVGGSQLYSFEEFMYYFRKALDGFIIDYIRNARERPELKKRIKEIMDIAYLR